jgi:hypothetical protein
MLYGTCDGLGALVSAASSHYTKCPVTEGPAVAGYPIGLSVRFEVFRAVTMKKAVIWDMTSCGPYKNRCFRGTFRLHHQVGKNQRTRNHISGN